jgi:hypothetical protein
VIRLAIALTGAVLVAVLATVALGGGTGDKPRSKVPQEAQFSAAARTPAETLRALSRDFSVLRRHHRARDRIAARAIDPVERSVFGVDPALSLRVLARGTPLYFVPGRSHVCLLTQAGAGGCNPSANVYGGALTTLEEGDPVPAGKVRLFGALPDGVKSVRVALGHGSSVTAPVRHNVWLVVVGVEPDRVTWKLHGHRYVFRTPH